MIFPQIFPANVCVLSHRCFPRLSAQAVVVVKSRDTNRSTLSSFFILKEIHKSEAYLTLLVEMNVIIDNNPTTIQWNTNILCIKNKSFPFWMLKITIFQIGHKRDGCHFTFLILRLDLPPTPTFDIFLSSMSLVFFLSDFLSSHLSASVCISQ